VAIPAADPPDNLRRARSRAPWNPMIEKLKRLVRANRHVFRASLSSYDVFLFPHHAKLRAMSLGMECKVTRDFIDIRKDRRAIRTGRGQMIYTFEIIDNFDFFHGAVEPAFEGEIELVDYSRPRLHHVRGYDRHPVLFPSLAEPIETTLQYLAFADLKEGSIALDLGAYSGLTSILFRDACGDSGRVVAVEADAANIEAARHNFAAYSAATGREIDLVEGAIWTHNDGIAFSSEGGMGSSATAIVGSRGSGAGRVSSMTLSELARRCRLDRVDFVKCDVEGAEATILADTEFFARHRPRMIVEVHPVAGKMTTPQVVAALSQFGYEHRAVRQNGIDLPLLECHPTAPARQASRRKHLARP
jgi:FkbM family methyltransferase